MKIYWRIYILLYLILCISLLYGISEYELELIKVINQGEDEGELYYWHPGAGGGSYPSAYIVSANDEIYVADTYNKRINIYSLDLNYLGQIKDKDENKISRLSQFIVDKDGSVIDYSIAYIRKFDIQGDLIFSYANEYKKKDAFGYNDSIEDVFILDDYIFFRYKNNGHRLITDEGTVIKGDKIKEIITRNTLYNRGVLWYDSGLKDKLEKFLEENELILYGNRLLTRDNYTFINYRNFIVKNIKDRKIVDKIKVDYEFISGNRLFGFDMYDNSYWFQSDYIVVFNKYGEVIDELQIIFYRIFGVSSAGDIYTVTSGPEYGSGFFRIKNVWSK